MDSAPTVAVLTRIRRLASSSKSISGNQAGRHGGGIHTGGGTLTVTHTTVSGNMANNEGGGLRASGTTVRLEYVTIANNTADANDDGSGDGGGIRRFNGTIDLSNTIIAGNIDSGGEAPDCAGTVASVSSTLIQNRIAGARSTQIICRRRIDPIAERVDDEGVTRGLLQLESTDIAASIPRPGNAALVFVDRTGRGAALDRRTAREKSVRERWPARTI